jgi:hypothetical protein
VFYRKIPEIAVQFSDAVLNDQAHPLFLNVENYKVNRIKGGENMSQGAKSIGIKKGSVKLNLLM